MGKGKMLRLMFSLFLIPLGAVFILIQASGILGDLISKLGLALIVAGVVSAFREVAILRLESEETSEKIANIVYNQLQECPPTTMGIRMISPIRRGFHGYYTWAVSNAAQNLFLQADPHCTVSI
jgi:hypothetical protein